MRNLFIHIFFFLLIGNPILAQRITVQEYIDTYKQLAMDEMLRTGVPAAIKLAQGIIETEAGNSALVQKSNNHFGIKCKENWTGEKVSHDDDARGECFRKYPTPQDSYRDHSDFLRTRKHYHFLFDLDPTDYKAWAYGLKKAGYATNPQYPQMLIRYIEQYQLNEYSLLAIGKKQDAKDSDNAAAQAVETQTPTGGNALPVKQVENSAAKEQQKQNIEKPASEVVTTAKKAAQYPSGVFRINDTKVIYARQGSSLLAIAQQYQLPLQQLLDFNEMEEQDLLMQDQLIYLQPKRRTGAEELHIVQEGETLHAIAQSQAIRLEALMEYNFLLSTQQPAKGEKLYLKTKAPAAPKLAMHSGAAASL